MNKKFDLKQKHIILFLIIVLAATGVFYFSAYDRINYAFNSVSIAEHTGYTQEISSGTELKQSININSDYLEYIKISVATFGRKNKGILVVELSDKAGNLISADSFKMEQIADNSTICLRVNKPVTEDEVYLRIYSNDGQKDNSITVYYNSDSLFFGDGFYENQEYCEGNLQLEVSCGNKRESAKYYWIIVGILLAAVFALSENTLRLYKKGKSTPVLFFVDSLSKYGFLIGQLVSRDFKTKYKRSVLGIFWSLLNPLMIMGVQYVLFSRIFRANIENYPIYLFGGTVLFTFFSDSVSNGLFSIVGNASLITKVHVPKFIYPISKVFSVGINLLLSLIPLTVALFITHVRITKAYLLIPFVLFCLLLFCFGMVFLISTAMVFFRDTQFIWGVLSMVWMYATPLFYPESILPEVVRKILRFNPMYNYVMLFRTILLEGVSPALSEYLWCLGSAIIVFVIGFAVFKKFEGRFALFV